eukprot:5422677-Amphidinium_carterae.1
MLAHPAIWQPWPPFHPLAEGLHIQAPCRTEPQQPPSKCHYCAVKQRRLEKVHCQTQAVTRMLQSESVHKQTTAQADTSTSSRSANKLSAAPCNANPLVG